jgi:hypothetical protein
MDVEMKKSLIVTYPRSGHHIMLGLLDTFLNVSDNYCEFYECKNNRNETISCCSAGLPWRKKNNSCGAGRKLIKTHDFDLDVPYQEDCNYLIQLRNPLLSISSWYELEKKKGGAVVEWSVFLEDKFNFWLGFTDKWLSLRDRNNILVVSYDSLGDQNVLEDIGSFLDLPAREVSHFDPNRFSPKRTRLIDSDGLLKNYESQITDRLETLGIQKLFT